ncbi:hypothetical protein BH11PLA2_BH11PLA2_23960 [soil metagenome]
MTDLSRIRHAKLKSFLLLFAYPPMMLALWFRCLRLGGGHQITAFYEVSTLDVIAGSVAFAIIAVLGLRLALRGRKLARSMSRPSLGCSFCAVAHTTIFVTVASTLMSVWLQNQ